MPRSVVALLLSCCALTACGSDEERTVRAPAAEKTASPVYQDCQSVVAVGSSSDAKLDKETRAILKEFREAQKDEDAEMLCSSDVDSIPDEDGWTPYAPLPEGTATP